MSSKALSKVLLAAAWLTGGMSLSVFGMIWVGHVMYDNIPTGRLVGYTLVLVAGVVATASLTVWHLLRKWRRAVINDHLALRVEAEQLRAERRTYDTLLEHIQQVDAQGEVNTVLLRKLIKQQVEERANADTQPIARLHSINGNSGA